MTIKRRRTASQQVLQHITQYCLLMAESASGKDESEENKYWWYQTQMGIYIFNRWSIFRPGALKTDLLNFRWIFQTEFVRVHVLKPHLLLWTSFGAFHLAYIEVIPEAGAWDDGGFVLIRAVLILCVKLKEILLEEHRKKDTNSWSWSRSRVRIAFLFLKVSSHW